MTGYADPHFDTPVKAFQRLFKGRRGGGALAVYLDGQLVVDVWAGTSDRAGQHPWQATTATMPYSASKAIASTVIHRLADRGLLDYEAPIAEYWPEFAARGKARITVADAMTHRAGLARLNRIAANVDEVLDHNMMQDRLAAAAPDRNLGHPTYHALTYGWLLAGIARGVTGRDMADLFAREVAEPLGTSEMYLGRPPASAPVQVADFVGNLDVFASRFAPMVLPRTPGIPGPVGGFIKTVYTDRIHELVLGDSPRILDAQIPAANSIVTARALASMYDALGGDGSTSAGRLLSTSTVRRLRKVQTMERDRGLAIPMGWRLGYHSWPLPGSRGAFGHIGLVGSAGIAAPELGLAMAFVHNRLPQPSTIAFDQMIMMWLAPLIARAAKAARQSQAPLLTAAS